jgi:uncharacterized protein (TIGR03435 family)
MRRVARIVRPSHYALAALACSLAFCGAACAQEPSASPSHPDGPNVTPTAVNRVGLDAVPANIHFDVVSFKPCPPGKEGTTKVDQPLDGDYLAYHCETVYRLIYFAYNGVVKDYDFVGNDVAWIYTDHYEFIAKVAPEDIPAWQKLDLTGRRILMRSVLAATLKLKVSLYNMQQPVYLLTVAKGGAKLKPYKDGDQSKMPDGRTLMGREVGWVGLVAYFQDSTMSQLAQLLGTHLDRNVVDRSGLTAPYTFSIPLAFGGGNDPNAHIPTQDDLSTAEGLAALGLRLETAKLPMDKLSIDHIERPEAN